MSKRTRQKGIFFSVRQFRSFIRLETCLYISCIGVSGFLLFNPLSITILPLFLAVLFLTGASYAYNHLTDKEEDRINNKRLNIFVTNGLGIPVVYGMLSLGFLFSLFLPLPSFLLFILGIPLIIAYSRLRVKEIFFVKNLYTGLTIGLTFLIGAAAGGFILAAFMSFPVAFFFGFMLNFLGDIRGYEGDMVAGVKTLPVAIGIDSSKRIAQYLFLGFSSSILILRCYPFYPLALFPFLISLSLAFDNHKTARALIITSFMVFSSLLFILKILEGGF
ncbi:MAG: UbiA family prenyltransferase [Candidatus Aenigmarchaeota archaeon]|nr:UbiA family prenyltransferase [Candidatus Aenigmarchaeota archaeon]